MWPPPSAPPNDNIFHSCIGCPGHFLAWKTDFKVGFDENGKLGQEQKYLVGLLLSHFHLHFHRYCRALRVQLGGVSGWFNLKLFTCSVWLGPFWQKAQSAIPGRSPKRKNLKKLFLTTFSQTKSGLKSIWTASVWPVDPEQTYLQWTSVRIKWEPAREWSFY